jgi:integrase
MPKIAFTDLTIRALQPGTYFDLKTPAFGIRVGKNRRTWIVLKGTKSTKVGLGHYPALSLAEARRKALIALGSPYQPSTAPTFPEARTAFLALPRWKPRAHYEISRTLNRHFHWQKPVDKITHAEIGHAIDAICAKSEAAHALKDLRTFFAWCTPRYVGHNPCDGLQSPSRYQPRTRLLTDEEIARIWAAASKLDGYGKQVQLLIATGQRANQIIKLQPSWIDRKNRLLKFPATVMKHNRNHVIPYPKLAEPLFESPRPTSYQGKRKRELDVLSGVSDYVLHDFRRYYSSTHAKLRTPIDCTEALLGHLSGSRSQIQRIYDQYDRLEEMRDAVHKYDRFLRNLISGNHAAITD